MHLTRPKSSKGRSRPAANSTDSGTPRSLVSPPDSPGRSRPDRALRSRSQPVMWQSGPLSRDEVMHVLQHAPAAPPPSLNKYKVLPSIERRRSEVTSLGEDLAKLSLPHHHGAILQDRPRQEELDLSTAQTSSSDGDSGGHHGPLRIWPKPPGPGPGPAPSREAGGCGSLLLAIRAPCGRRFQQLFEPTDTLLTVRASAEARYGARYGEASIETMDVPRRSFTDMDLTLAQCGILNRSVLCISQTDGSVVDHD